VDLEKQAKLIDSGGICHTQVVQWKTDKFTHQ